MAHRSFEGKGMLVAKGFIAQIHGKALVTADFHRVAVLYFLAGFEDCRPCIVLVGESIALNGNLKIIFG